MKPSPLILSLAGASILCRTALGVPAGDATAHGSGAADASKAAADAANAMKAFKHG
jgi:hypothetical protein